MPVDKGIRRVNAIDTWLSQLVSRPLIHRCFNFLGLHQLRKRSPIKIIDIAVGSSPAHSTARVALGLGTKMNKLSLSFAIEEAISMHLDSEQRWDALLQKWNEQVLAAAYADKRLLSISHY